MAWDSGSPLVYPSPGGGRIGCDKLERMRDFDPPRWLKPGDVVEVEGSGIGTLRNTVVDEA